MNSFFVRNFFTKGFWADNFWFKLSPSPLIKSLSVEVGVQEFLITFSDIEVFLNVLELEVSLMSVLIGEVEWYRGDSYPLELTVKDKETESPVDLNGYSFKLTVDTKQNPEGDTTKLFSVDGVLDDDPTTGKVTFTPTTSDTNLSPKTYYYDVQMIDSTGNIRTIVKNKFKITQDITK